MQYESYPQPAPESPPRKRRALFPAGKPIRAAVVGVLLGLAGFTLIAGAMILSFYFYYQVSERILLGVMVGEIDLGNRSIDEAADRLEDTWNADEYIHLSDGEQTWAASARSLGLAIDAQATAQQAQRIGRSGKFFADIGAALTGLFGSYQIAPVVALDRDTAREGLNEWADTIAAEPVNATIAFEGGQVVAVPAVPGYTLDVEASLDVLAYAPGAIVAEGVLPLALTPVQPAVTDVSPVLAEARQLLAGPLTLTAYDPVTDVSTTFDEQPEVVASWLAVEDGESGPQITVDQAALETYFAALENRFGTGLTVDAEVNAEPVAGALRAGEAPTVILGHAPTVYTVQTGDTLTSISWDVGMTYWRILEANPDLDPDALVVGQMITIPSKDDLLPLPVVLGKRLKVSIGSQRLWVYENGEMIHEFVISTGIEDSPTQPGVFQVQTHELSAYASSWDLFMPHFLGIYEAWPGFMNGFHGLPTRNGGQILWAASLGHPTSYGCIILDIPDAEWLYNWADDGVVVEIVK